MRPEVIAGVEYVTFEGDLDESALRPVANVSTAFALFQRDERRIAAGGLRTGSTASTTTC